MKKTKLKKHLATGEYMSVLIITVTIMIEEKKKSWKEKNYKKMNRWNNNNNKSMQIYS